LRASEPASEIPSEARDLNESRDLEFLRLLRIARPATSGAGSKPNCREWKAR